jgi:hypothetical protein
MTPATIGPFAAILRRAAGAFNATARDGAAEDAVMIAPVDCEIEDSGALLEKVAARKRERVTT